MIDDKSINYQWPKPHRDNLLSEDVGRLRETIDSIDGQLKIQDTALGAYRQELQALKAQLQKDIVRNKLLALAGL